MTEMTETGYDPAAAITEKLKEMTADEAVKMTRELCAQLDGDAEQLHGNIWPENIRIDWEGKAVLGEPSDAPANRREAEQVEYMAPEFFWDNEGSAASDVYSLGLLLYAACSGGYLPFQPTGGALTPKDRSGALRKRMKGEPIEPPTGVTPALADVIRKALAYEPEARYISAAAFLRALGETDEALPAGEPEPFVLPDDPEPEAEAEDPVFTEEPEPLAEEPEPEPEKTIDDVLTEDLSFQELPEGTESAEAPPPKAEAAPAPEAEAAPAPETEAGLVPEPTAEQTAAPASLPETDQAPVSAPKLGRKQKKKLKKQKQAQAQKDVLAAIPEPEPIPEPEAKTDISAADPAPEPANEQEAVSEPEEPKYTVQKDFKKNAAARTAVPAVNRKKKTSPLIPILCVAAVVVIAAVIVMLRTPGVTKPAEESAAVTYTIEPSQPTPTPAAAEITPSLGDDEEEAEAEDPEEETAEEEPEDLETAVGVPVGSALIDGMTVDAVRDVVEIADTGANLRTGPGTSYSVADSLPRGTMLVRTGTVNGWSQVQYNDSEYYVASNLVSVAEGVAVESLIAPAAPASESAPAQTPAVETGKTDVIGTLVVTSDVNIRSGAGTGYDKVGEAKSGATLTVTGRSSDGKWYLITCDGVEGYVNRNLVSVRDYAVITPQSGTLTVDSEVNIRSGPSTGYDILGVAKAGDALTVTGAADTGWYRVDYSGQTAYVATGYGTVN